MPTNDTPDDRLASDVADLKSTFDSFRATLPEAYIPRREYEARWQSQDRALDMINQKLDKLIGKSDDASPLLATAIQRITTLENDLASTRLWIRGSLTTAAISLILFVLQFYLYHK